jgi:hypothetical protein
MNDFTRRYTDKMVVNSVTVVTNNPPPKTEAELTQELTQPDLTPNDVVRIHRKIDNLNEER